ncbi:MAG: hypothetical protein KDD45_17775, partial [Bdellovibrionales bacterium]|nr:hypothetical protein [Bdellovibrionales bacterium]
EGIDTTNHRRMRVYIEGSLDTTTNKFSSVTTAKGFWMQGDGSGYLNFVTFIGNPTSGFLGNNYPTGGSNDLTDKCYLPGKTVTCTGLTSIAGSDANGTSQYTSLSAARTTLAAYTSALINTSTIDPSDTDITQ